MSHELMTLPFAMDALSPHISRETLEYHHGKHHRTYVNKLNELIKGTEFEGLSLSDLVKKTTGPTFNNAAQVWNHNFYWYGLKPQGSDKPAGELAAAIDRNFGSFDQFATQFKTAAATKFGAGWTWLVKTEDGKLAIRNSNDAENPLQWNQIPLLTCDVWEHAYYIDYRNERPRYIEAFWGLIDWDFVARNLAGKGIPF
ncbi:Fe-Mn family superoxide dismutase [Ferrovum sp.]|uniref:superoxide dismutase n=2 Tax=Ferrovum sp. TaxID=2609467 RepID=UPI00261F9928|nr:Fe-Mn family superoxide dismutase [Ferrovum sp.]MBW8066654.1 superoxide dismutase [Fe] [Ferrovum sp.]